MSYTCIHSLCFNLSLFVFFPKKFQKKNKSNGRGTQGFVRRIKAFWRVQATFDPWPMVCSSVYGCVLVLCAVPFQAGWSPSLCKSISLFYFSVFFLEWSFIFTFHVKLRHHGWEDAKTIEYLEKVDKKYGTSYAIDNMGHHDTRTLFRVASVPYPGDDHHAHH